MKLFDLAFCKSLVTFIRAVQWPWVRLVVGSLIMVVLEVTEAEMESN